MFLYNLAAIVKQETDKRISSDFSLNFKKHTYQVSLSFTLNTSMILVLLKSEIDFMVQTIYSLTEEAA